MLAFGTVPDMITANIGQVAALLGICILHLDGLVFSHSPVLLLLPPKGRSLATGWRNNVFSDILGCNLLIVNIHFELSASFVEVEGWQNRIWIEGRKHPGSRGCSATESLWEMGLSPNFSVSQFFHQNVVGALMCINLVGWMRLRKRIQ